MLYPKVKLFNGLLIIFAFLVSSVSGQGNDCQDLQKLIDKTYDFKPSKLNSAEQTAKSAEMDIVWNKVKANKEKLVPCIKRAMKKPDANNFFIFNAGNLIFSLDRSDEAKKILIEAFAKVDLEDVNLAYWMRYIAALGFEGFDTTAAGENWLRSSVEGYYLPQHGTRKVSKDAGSLIIYGSMEEKFATPALAKIASQETHPARNVAIFLLMQQATPEAFEKLKTFNKNGLSENSKSLLKKNLENPKLITPREGKPKTSREQYLAAFKDIANGNPKKFIDLTIEVSDGEKDVVAVMKKEDIPLIRKARRFHAAIATPHSPEWYQSFTEILMTMLKMPETEKK